MIFGLMLATVLLITHVKKLRNRKCQKWDKCLQITTSPFEFEWIAIEMSESLCGGKGAVSVILKLDLLWFEGIYLIFGTFDFLVFLRG